jgi:hypothetical protein
VPDETGCVCGWVVQSGRALQASAVVISKHCLSEHDGAGGAGQLHGASAAQSQPLPKASISQRLSAEQVCASSALQGSIGCATAWQER